MSLPPQVIQVKVRKRERDDEGRVEFLRVDGVNKRHRSDNYVYQRREESSAEDIESEAGRHTSPTPLKPVIHTSKPGDENAPFGSIRSPPKTIRDASTHTTMIRVNAANLPVALPEAKKAPLISREPRRFHMARVSLTPTPPSILGKGIGKRRHITPTVFVEQTAKKKRLQNALEKSMSLVSRVGFGPTGTDQMDVEMIDTRRHKLPGSGRRTPLAAKPDTTAAKKELPPSMQGQSAADMDEFAQNMNQYVLQHIGENLSRTEERDKLEAAVTAKKAAVALSQSSRFKPMTPAKRYAERHPEVSSPQQPEIVDTVMDDSDTGNDDDYVIETYIRVPVTSLGSAVAPEKIGLLVFDNEPDASYFYGEEGDSDDDYNEDDEDENAEDYYTADYPDDEVDSDDEFGRDPYHYRTGNASDLEEFDDEGESYAIDEDEPSQFAKFVEKNKGL